MLIVRTFSRHTPHDLEKYESRDGRKLTRGQRLAAIEDEYDRALRNEERYAAKKRRKWGVSGALAGAALGAAVGGGRSAVHGTIVGGLGGLFLGDLRGRGKARKEGHNPEVKVKHLARYYDELARASKGKDQDDYEIHARRHIKDRTAEYLARENAAASRQTGLMVALK